MEAHDLKREVRTVLEEAAHAADSASDGLMDRTDLQRLVSHLQRILKRLDRAYDELEAHNRELVERLCRSHPFAGPAGHNPSTHTLTSRMEAAVDA